MARLLRDFLLLVFGYFVTLAIPALAEITHPQMNVPIRVVIIIAVAITAIPYLGLLYWLGKLEERQQDKRDKKMIKDLVKELGYEQRHGNELEHLQSIL